ncbi:NUDIX hydrolase, partial [Candidatus Woesearchaeota archaeon]|nr:NUDIX hydrolase [Candidatus Woesearchaeota archaeon]
ETPEEALRRETKEETGAIITEELKQRGNIIFKYTKTWAKTKKQKLRFKKYCGEQMFFFSGKIKSLNEIPTAYKDAWKGQKLMSLTDVFGIVNKTVSSDELRNYRLKQKSILKSLIK